MKNPQVILSIGKQKEWLSTENTGITTTNTMYLYNKNHIIMGKGEDK